MNTHTIDKYKLKAVLLFIVKRLDVADFHKIFKILYFADRQHLVRFGRPISLDQYVAMKFGPVPSFTYDIFKAIKGDGYFSPELKYIYEAFEIKADSIVKANQEPDLDELSSSDVECLSHAVDTYKDYSFDSLSEMSHDFAWKSVQRDYSIDILDIAKAGGANEVMLQYIAEQEENNHLTLA